MAEVINATRLHKCDGCQRIFDHEDDICYSGHPWVEGGQARNANYCRRCHITALGSPPPHEFKQFDKLND